jgi:hypothetical protein
MVARAPKKRTTIVAGSHQRGKSAAITRGHVITTAAIARKTKAAVSL